MAEFKLGRIRFVWKGNWAPTTVYYKDDVVKYGGKTYICQVGHTADSNFYTDLEFVPTKWNQMTDGQEWRDSWTADTFYKAGDIVRYGATVYICNEPHTSAATTAAGLEADLGKWDTFVEGLDWKGNWATDTQYKQNDLVRYGGNVYVCATAHTSQATAAAGLEADILNWTPFNEGIEFKGTWSASSVRYKINDVVKYGAGLWICTTAHTSSGAFADQESNWAQFVKGFEFEEEWNISTVYQPGDVVRYGGNQYIAKTNHAGQVPSTAATHWALFSEGLNYVSDWNITTSYKVGDVVKVNGYTYVAIADSPSYTQTVTATAAATDRFTVTTTTGFAANQAVQFSGTTFGNVFPGATYYVRTIDTGLDFTITTVPGGTKFEAATATGSMTARVAAHPAVSTSVWQNLTRGVSWRGEWIDDTEYELGDTVRYGSNTYICVQKHRSESDDGSSVLAQGGGADNSRPDQDTAAVYWNVLTIGSEVSVLTTKGDMVYFDNNGPSRLPIGIEGQVLRVSEDSLPEWITLGASDHTYYVATHGVDDPAPIHGLTWDKPWKSIRYACEQVEQGPRNPIAKRLLEMNRIFIQREVTEWIQYQIANASVGSIWENFVYEDFKCERDTGLIVDALIHDVSHGGNVKTRGAALALINGLQDSPGTYSKLAQEADNDSAAWSYMVDVIEAVLNQEAPTVNYQDTNTDNSTAKVTQWFDASLGATEAEALPQIESLVGLITDALVDGDPDNVPARYAPSNLINIATGQYREVLPIIVPEQTCVLGAELRSTNAGPIGSTVDASDSKYSLGALGRLEAIVGDIVTGANVSETVGNTETQSTAWPLASSVQGDDLKQLVRAMQYRVDFNLGLTNYAQLTDPTGYNTVTYLNGYGDARKLLRENKKFLQDEIIAYIAVNYPNVKYSKTACRRDVGYIVDAMIYDLTYGGNTQTINAGLAYYDGPGSTYSINEAELTATIASYGRLKTVMQQIVANTTVTKTTGNLATQWTDSVNLPNGNLASSFIGANIDIIVNIIAGDSTAGNPPQVRVTSITAGNVANTAAAHGLGAGDTFTPEVSGNGFIAGTTYYVLTTPSGTQFTCSTSFGGSTLTLTNGTGLDIEGAVVNWPAATDAITTTTALITAFTTLSAVVPTIKTNTIDYINSTYGNFVYDSSKCRRDTGLILDGVYYDVAFGTNFNAIYNGISYRRAMASEVIASQLNQTTGAIKYAKTLTAASLASSGTAVTRSNASFNEIVDIISNGVAAADAITWTDPGVDANKRYAREQLQTNRAFIIDELISWIAVNYPAVVYDTDTCRRDTGYIIDAFSYDVQYGGNTATRRAAIAYFEGAVSVLPSGQKAATAAAMTQLGVICASVAQETYAGQDTSGTAASGTEGTQITTLAAIIEEVVTADSLSGLDAEVLPSITWAAAGIQTAVAELAFDKTDIIIDTLQYISDNYNSFTYNHRKCSRDVGIILDAVGYDFMFNSNFQTWKSALAYLRATASEVYSAGQKDATRGALEYVRTQAIANVGGNATAISRINSLMQLVDDVIFAGSNDGSTCASEDRLVDYAYHQLERNRDYIVAEIDAYIKQTYKASVTNTTDTTNVITVDSTAWLQRNTAIVFEGTTFGNIVAGQTYYVQNVVSSTTFKIATTRDSNTALTLSTASGTCTVKLVYNEELCLRDVNEYISALKYDIKWPGNYKSLLAARYYTNAVRGSLEEDMFYLRDGTGVRDMTLQGLTGDLTSPNEYGTSRVTAGAYCSLDPGWGPDDFRAWIINRSPYIQGVTTFGYACIGQKIDGALHNGGNDSMVSNDFTQVLSDGIGAWVANNGRAELVSVFTYYNHIGYLTTEGGRIRGTNGNNSYGDFGSVAEGFDMTEVPNTAIVDNKFQFNATVAEVNTNGSQIQNFEFENAGIDYTEVAWTVTGGGNGAAALGNEFRDGAVHSVRLTEVEDPDPTSSDAYNGQFGGSGYITNANTAQGGTTTSITLAATDAEISTAYIGMKVYLTAGAGVGQYGIVATYNNGTKLATVVKESDGTPGWDHVIPGTTIAQPDASTTYVMEPAISFTAPTYASAAGTAAETQTYGDIKYVDTIVPYTNVTGSVSSSGINATFRVIRAGSKYTVFTQNAGSGFIRLETITIDGSSIGGVSGANDIVITVTSVNVNGAITGFDFVGTGIGGNYVAIRSDSTDAAYTSTGGAWTAETLPSTNTWSSIAAGRVTYTEAITAVVVGKAYRITTLGTANNFITIGAPVNQVGTDFIATAGGFGDATVTPLITRLVAISTGSNATAYSDDGGATWTAGGNLPAVGTWNKVAYGNGRWIAIKTGSADTAYSDDGINWLAGGALPASTTWTDITFGANKWVAIASGGVAAASSVNNGGTWLSRVLPSSSNWSSVIFGNNKFVAVSSTSGTAAAYSLDGFIWTASTIVSAAYNRVTYGQGVFFAVGNSTTAASSEDGLLWTSRTISTSNSVGVAFGNVTRTPRFRTISSSGASNTSEIICGARARGRAYVAEGRIFRITVTEPGSAYTSAPTMTIVDPNNIYEAPFTVRIGSGVLANPTFTNRGSSYVTGSAEVFTGNGYADFYQTGSFIAVRRITQRPVPGSNVVFDSIPGQTFKLVTVVTFLGSQDGSYTAFFQISPPLSINQSPEHDDGVTTRIRYSQVRLTGHDFLDIGTGNFDETNYPGGEPENDPAPANETVANNGGRVFYTSTDQDGNFRVGELFAIEQSTGIATLNADAFNISGLQELNLGNVTLGGGSATITEFSTDPFFTADSDNVVPTQRAIKAFIAAQIGGGGASLNVNSVTAGSIFINSNQITTTTGVGINVNATMEFRRGVTGVPLALNYFFK